MELGCGKYCSFLTLIIKITHKLHNYNHNNNSNGITHLLTAQSVPVQCQALVYKSFYLMLQKTSILTLLILWIRYYDTEMQSLLSKVTELINRGWILQVCMSSKPTGLTMLDGKIQKLLSLTLSADICIKERKKKSYCNSCLISEHGGENRKVSPVSWQFINSISKG